jgi:hypothetical protein
MYRFAVHGRGWSGGGGRSGLAIRMIGVSAIFVTVAAAGKLRMIKYGLGRSSLEHKLLLGTFTLWNDVDSGTRKLLFAEAEEEEELHQSSQMRLI